MFVESAEAKQNGGGNVKGAKGILEISNLSRITRRFL